MIEAQVPQEEEIWWGGYSLWVMLPSFFVCIVLTLLVGWAVWMWQVRAWMQWTLIGAAAPIWLIQLARCAYRVFGTSYRLTNRRLFVDHGLGRVRRTIIDITTISQVAVKCAGYQKWINRGQVRVYVQTHRGYIALDGVRSPAHVADRIRKLIEGHRVA